MTVDFGKRSEDYGAHRPGFPGSFYERLNGFIELEGARALDVGTGPGIVALELAKRGADVIGIDIADNQVRVAQERAASADLADRCHFQVAAAESTGLPTSSFDLVTAGQCWVWFDQERAIAELQRVLAPGGVLVVAHYCYLPLYSEVARRTEELVLSLNPSWHRSGNSGLYPEQIDPLILGGFELIEQFCYDHEREMSHEAWRGRMRTCNGVGSGSLSAEAVAQFDRLLTELLAEEFPDEPLSIRHRVWATVVRKP